MLSTREIVLLATAPGVVVHELAHEFACVMSGITVRDVTYFQLDSPVGFVEHGAPKNWIQAAAISLAPLGFNVLFAATALLSAFRFISGDSSAVIVALTLCWLAFSSLVHSFPSIIDTQNLWSFTYDKFWRWPLLPLVGVIYGVVKLIYSVGYLSVILVFASITTPAILVLMGVSPEPGIVCLLNGQWGCWGVPPVQVLLGL
jgi:hypothetical protein